MCGRLAIISNPHQISVDEDGEVVASIVAGTSVADESRWHKLRGGSCKAIQRSWHRESAVWVEDLGMLGHRSLNTGAAGDVTDQRRFVIEQVLSEPCVGPAIVEVLKPCVLWPVIREVHQYGLLDVAFQKSPFLDFSEPVVEGPC